MKYAMQQDGCRGTSSRRFLMKLAVASLIGGLSIAPAFADRSDGHGRNDHRGGHDQRGRHDDRDRHDYRGGYNYAQPVWVPPTVYAAPQESPGVSLFLPLNLRF